MSRLKPMKLFGVLSIKVKLSTFVPVVDLLLTLLMNTSGFG